MVSCFRRTRSGNTGRLYSGQAALFLSAEGKSCGDSRQKGQFRGAHVVGWVIEAVAISLFLGAAAFCVRDGTRRDFGQFFVRFRIVLNGMRTYDIFFFDWVLLCRSNFFHFYPERKSVVGLHMFGYNAKSTLLHFAIYLPACAAAAWIFAMLRKAARGR